MPRWVISLLSMPGNRVLLLLTICVLASATLMLQPGAYIATGNLHDLFIPYNAVLALQQGLQLHVDFHTPFGWVYPYLNKLAWDLIVNLPGTLSTADLMVVCSMLAGLCVTIMHLAVRLFLPRNLSPDKSTIWLVALFLLLVALNFRGKAGLAVHEITWYGTYNSHLWALVLLQLFWISVLAHITEPSRRMVGVIAALNGLAAMLALNYKVSFGAASVLLAAAPLAILPLRNGLAPSYVATGLVTFLSMGWLLYPQEYSYAGYLHDLSTAAMAKTQLAARTNWSNIAWALLLAAVLSYQFNLRSSFRSKVLGCGLALSIYLGVLGDFGHSPFYFFAAWALVTLAEQSLRSASTQGWTPLPAVAVLLFGILTNLAQTTYIGFHKLSRDEPARFVRLKLDTHFGEQQWLVPRTQGYSQLAQYFGLARHPDQVALKLGLAFPAGATIKGRLLPFPQQDYVAMLDSATRFVKAYPSARSVFLEFTDPLPLLAGTAILTGSYHWFHFGTSFPFDGRDDEFHSLLNGADVVVLPVTNIDYAGQTLLNCKFYLWNQSIGTPFKLVSTDTFNLYFMRSANAADLIDAPTGQAVVNRCDALVKETFSRKKIRVQP